MFNRFIHWIEGLFGSSQPPSTPAAHGEPSRGNGGELEMSSTFGWDKTGGWSPHGDEGMR